jgi:arginyl-tRNA synthetase
MPDKENTAKIIGTGSVIFGALSNNKIKDIVFSYDKVLNFEGETCPYVQYTVARCNSVIEKSGVTEYDLSAISDVEISPVEYELISKIATFKEVVLSSSEKYEPSFIARFAVDVAKLFNKFYFDCKILAAEDEKTKNFRLALTNATLQTLKNAFALLGIGIPDKM